MTKRKKYTKEFKLDAISLVRDQNISVAEASRNLGVSPQMLGRWIKEEESEDGQAFRGNGSYQATHNISYQAISYQATHNRTSTFHLINYT